MEHIITTFLPQFLPIVDLVEPAPISKLAKKHLYSIIQRKYTCDYAAENGHLELLKILRATPSSLKCFYSAPSLRTCYYAAKCDPKIPRVPGGNGHVIMPPKVVIWMC
jgi:hypothetical protein